MRILIAVGSMHPSQGGPPVVVAGHAETLAKQGHEVTVVTTTLAGEASETVAAWPQLIDVEFLQFQRDKPYALGSSKSLKKYLAENVGEFDVAHLHGVWEQCLAHVGKYAKKHSVPYVLAPHGMLDKYSMAHSKTKKWIARYIFGTQSMLKNVSAVQFGTEDERDEAGELNIPWRPVIIRNGVSESLFEAKKSELQLGSMFPKLNNANPLFVFFSRMHYKKGVDILLEAFANVTKEFPDAKCLIAALAQDAFFEEQIRQRASRSDLENAVVITTELTGAKGAGVLQAADVFVLPSRQEGFSMAILEAMANQLPVLITDKCHMDFVGEVGAGVVCSDSIAEVTDGLRQILSLSDQQRQNYGERGREWVRDNCTWTAIGQQLEETYRSLVKA